MESKIEDLIDFLSGEVFCPHCGAKTHGESWSVNDLDGLVGSCTKCKKKFEVDIWVENIECKKV